MMILSPIFRLARLTGYPESELDLEAKKQDFSVDGYAVTIEELARAGESEVLRFSSQLDDVGERVTELVRFAAGRLLKETATLAYDAEKKAAFLWDEMSARSRDEEFVARFAAFLNSCDWWRRRVEELAIRPEKIPDLVIRP